MSEERFEQHVTQDKWLDGPPPLPMPPDGEDTWRLVTVVRNGSDVAFYWQRPWRKRS
jgi:hypothetical protein